MQPGQLIRTAVLALALLASRQAFATDEVLTLSSLRDGCSIRRTWVGLYQLVNEVAMLQCGDQTFVVRSPNNLIGHVKIDTPEKALEYVRFFTSPKQYMLFDLNALVEVVPGTVDAHSPFNVIRPPLFHKYLKPASVENDDKPCRTELPYLCGHHFRITRPLAGVDNHIYLVIESVYESGVYAVTYKKVAVKDATKLGVLHFGEI